MKSLKVENGKVYFLDKNSKYQEIDQIEKEGLLYLLNKAIEDDSFEMDEYSEESIQNKAHQIIYKNIFNKFKELLQNRTRFKDESRQMYKEAFEKYSSQED